MREVKIWAVAFKGIGWMKYLTEPMRHKDHLSNTCNNSTFHNEWWLYFINSSPWTWSLNICWSISFWVYLLATGLYIDNSEDFIVIFQAVTIINTQTWAPANQCTPFLTPFLIKMHTLGSENLHNRHRSNKNWQKQTRISLSPASDHNLTSLMWLLNR